MELRKRSFSNGINTKRRFARKNITKFLINLQLQTIKINLQKLLTVYAY